MTLALHVHRLSALLPADEKSGLAAALKRTSQQPISLIAQADANEEPADAIATLNKCEAPLRELLTIALLAQQLKMLSRTHLRHLRASIHKTRKLIDDEIESWTQAAEETPAPGDDPSLKIGNDDDADQWGDDAIGLTDRAPRPASRFWPLRRAA